MTDQQNQNQRNNPNAQNGVDANAQQKLILLANDQNRVMVDSR